ncbi:MAG: FtsQ-type POTRA domain-containing protein [Verrucomicrobiae bacterium]|nr:FtsQ-type POTRA domain-containing protein [Verrucomicrobiae bacterium]
MKMRSRDARRGRMRALTTAVSVVAGTATGGVLLWQGYQWALDRFVYSNEAYAIRRLELRHEGRLRPDQIRQWANVHPGQNLLALDLDRVRYDLELNPWIAWADVEAHRPDGIRLTVWEREPVAQVVVWRFSVGDGRAWPETNYLDAAGFVLPPLRREWVKPGESIDFSFLPQLVGLDGYPVIPGQVLRHRMAHAALELIRAYEWSSLYPLVDLDRVDVSGSHLLTGMLRQGTEVTFATFDFERQMRHWRSIHDYGERHGLVAASLDLSITNNLPVRWRTNAVSPESPPPRPAKPKRSPPRHV